VILSCDIDSTVNDHWRRVQRHAGGPAAYTREATMNDQPLPGAVETLRRFAAAGWTIRYLTARNWDLNGDASREWLTAHDFPNAQAVGTVVSMSAKPAYLRAHPADLHIDDFSVGQESPGDPPPVRVRHDVIEDMPCPYHVFQPFGGGWAEVLARYFRVLPNGEPFWKFQVRNLEWWRANRGHEYRSRPAYYQNFLGALNFQPERYRTEVVAEIGAGPFGGMIKPLELGRRRYYVDPLATAQRTLGFVGWTARDIHLDLEAEDLSGMEERVDVLLSYNALDHGHDIRRALRQAVAMADECFLAFDCKGTGTPEHDRLDHYQTVDFEVVSAEVRQMAASGLCEVRVLGDLRVLTPGFHFEHNWGFPVFCCHLIGGKS
jgi:hypothetical protein